MTSSVSNKGQVTIPKAIRDKLGLGPGATIELKAVKGQLVGRKKNVADRFAKWRGSCKLPGGGSVNAYLRRVRGC